MLISGLVVAAGGVVATGGVVAGSWGIQSYRNNRKKRTLVQILSLERLIPRGRVQNEIMYAGQ